MANHSEYVKAASPFYGHHLFQVFLCGNNARESSDRPEKTQNEIVAVTHTRGPTMLKSSSSAYDLRCSDFDKERQDASSPTAVLESCFQISESDATSNRDNTTESETRCSKSRAVTNWIRFFKIWKKSSTKHLPKLSKTGSRSTKGDPEMTHVYKYKSSLKEFTLSELQTATDNFSSDNIIGKGGFSEVYKGCLQDGTLVAIKKLTKGTVEEKTCVFLCEIGIIAHVDHPNTAKLIGCDNDGMHLVFQLSPLGSLGSLLNGSKDKLDWSKRYKIAVGTANGLAYLHEGCEKRIIHRDIKADNILLTEDFEPQICDFGLAKWLPRQWTHHNVSKFEGTFGYFAPEYFMHGIVDEKTDVYAFGVLLLELITGRQAVDQSQQNVVVWAKPLLDNNDLRELVDPSLGNDYNPEEMDCVVLTASLCTEQSPILRPRMSQVLVLLRGDEYITQNAKKSQKHILRRTYSEELFDAQEYNSTRYLGDMKRFKEIALGT